MTAFLMWFFTDPPQLILAGALGGFSRFLALWADRGTQTPTLRELLSWVLLGAICAFYLEPIAASALNSAIGGIIPDGSARLRLSGFAIGLGGVVVPGYIMDVWALRRKKASE